jgi:hypothetical protein
MPKYVIKGYAIDDEESAVGIGGVGAPIFDSSGKVVASIRFRFQFQNEQDDREGKSQCGKDLRAPGLHCRKQNGGPGDSSKRSRGVAENRDSAMSSETFVQ